MSDDLRKELEQVQTAIMAAEKADAQVAGGLVKSLIATRKEILRTTEALIWQRIHANESGAPITIQVSGTRPDLNRAMELEREIHAKEQELSSLRADAARYSGGLVLSLKLTAIATQEQTIALLQQGMLTAKYGLALVPAVTSNADVAIDVAEASAPRASSKEKLISVKLLQKTLADNHVLVMDLDFMGTGLKKAARAVKGSLNLSDLFGETRLRINWTIDQALGPGGSVRSRGLGFRYNQFMENHQWVHRTAAADIVVSFEAAQVIYQDGTREEF